MGTSARFYIAVQLTLGSDSSRKQNDGPDRGSLVHGGTDLERPDAG